LLNSTLIGTIEKAKRYAEEPDRRIVFHAFRVTVEGDNHEHQVDFDGGAWSCDCETFDRDGYCPHTMTMERVLGDMITPVPIVEDQA